MPPPAPCIRSTLSPTGVTSRPRRYSPYPDPANRASRNYFSCDSGPQHAANGSTASQGTSNALVGSAPDYQGSFNLQSSYSQDYSRGGVFENAHHFAIHNPVFNDNSDSNNFMNKLEEYTIPGAAFDDSDRDPPPRCHPDTRLAILQRAQNFFTNHQRNKNILWLVGPAGVGKSAIMQSLAENVSSSTPSNIILGSLFFSVNGRDDGSKTFTTFAYQIAVHNSLYRRFVQNEVANDPKLLRKSLPTQFRKLIIEPFIGGAFDESHRRYLILIDGLDECNGNETQRQIVDLISSFCTAPFVWIISSRPEPHITSFFTGAVALACEKEEIVIDSDEAREDVERYLRDELGKLRPKYPALPSKAQWPREGDFIKLSAGANGLFAFASTAVRFIDDPESGDPESRLVEILEVIDNILSQPRDNDAHPMAKLDALYSRILSRVPIRTLLTTKKVLLGIDMTSTPNTDNHFAYLCNWLGLASNIAYGALYQLHSVLDIPPQDDAHIKPLKYFHKSFRDYFFNFDRSGMFRDPQSTREELELECAQRVLGEAADTGINGGLGPGVHGVLVSWNTQNTAGLVDDATRARLYLQAMQIVTLELHRPSQSTVLHFFKLFDMRIYLGKYSNFLTTWPPGKCNNEESLIECGVLHDILIGKLDTSNIDWTSPFFDCLYRSKSPVIAYALALDKSDFDEAPLYKTWRLEGGRHRVWCDMDKQERESQLVIFVQHFKHWQIHSPDLPITVFIDIRNWGFLYCDFADPVADPADGARWSCCIPYCFPSVMGI
ncbi:hypothetical protein P691DRAFT_770717 [Macrolepiota fuliginosa MF-IS2]|uniref:NACHT domain-containing protein n=1 Tax=Macrolepiota fuliginosa MF-IS2 TaxID=1400762 RepID=A0A9P5XRA9_9AGAR|nr:hypothetical protein P691DRAFT_770717 [Macrolepiota fuliginosa MF-IS2]